LDQGPRRRQFRPQRHQNQQRQAHPRPSGIWPPANPRQAAANARNNYERYTNLAKDAARRGEIIEAENLYQHAEHYFRTMREQE
jgi:multidrug resistance efflux pump